MKWREMANFEETYEGLEDLIVRDQYFITCPKELKTFLKEQGKLDLKQMTEKSTNYNQMLYMFSFWPQGRRLS